MDGALWSSVIDLLGGAEQAASAAWHATPLDYAAYSDLALTVPGWQNFSGEMRDEAESHLQRRLAELRDRGAEKPVSRPRIRTLSDSEYSPLQLQRLGRWFAVEEANTIGLAPADDAELERVRKATMRALDYMEEADPELFGETLAVIDEIIVVRQDGTERFMFSGGSSFAVWGAILANEALLPDWSEIYNTLAHEEGHLLLFAIARDEPLVLNPNDAAFASPVRDDPRPMDGIYHTAFVVAREARALARLLAWHDETGAFSPADEALVAEKLEASVIAFWQSVEALDKDAVLSDLGRSILDECRDYMARNFELVTQ